jgi:hypothetical protein
MGRERREREFLSLLDIFWIFSFLGIQCLYNSKRGKKRRKKKERKKSKEERGFFRQSFYLFFWILPFLRTLIRLSCKSRERKGGKKRNKKNEYQRKRGEKEEKRRGEEKSYLQFPLPS